MSWYVLVRLHTSWYVLSVKILVHAQDSCACTTLLAGPAADFLLGPGLGSWPLQCMHKCVVHAQECCACTRILCIHKNLVHAIESYNRIKVSYNSIIVSYLIPQTELAMRGSDGVGLEGAMKSGRERPRTPPLIFAVIYGTW